MAYRIVVDDGKRLVLCLVTGDVGVDEAATVAREVRSRAHELAYPILYDFTGAAVKASLTEAYSFPRDIDSIY